MEVKDRKMIRIPEEKKVRVIIDTDAACEADDPFAIVQALLSPKLVVKGILAEHFNEKGSVERSFKEIKTILDAMKIEVPVFMGLSGPLSEGGEDRETSEAVDFIVYEALKQDDMPLFILCQGAISNVAAALRKCPAIKDRLTVVWIGTHGVEEKAAPFREFNAGNDITAANEVLCSGARVWLIPSDVYTTITVGLAELKLKVYPRGTIGRHLYENMVEYNMSPGAWWTQGESWSLGDSPAVAVTINPGCGHFIEARAPHVNEDTSSAYRPDNPLIRVYTDIDSRYILEDFFAKLALFDEENCLPPHVFPASGNWWQCQQADPAQ